MLKKKLNEVIWNMKRKHLRHIEHCVILITLNECLRMDIHEDIKCLFLLCPRPLPQQ